MLQVHLGINEKSCATSSVSPATSSCLYSFLNCLEQQWSNTAQSSLRIISENLYEFSELSVLDFKC